MVCWRGLDLHFPQLRLTPYETQKLGSTGANMSGFLVWRRSVLRPCVVLACIGSILRLLVLIRTYSTAVKGFLLDYFGPTLWNTVFCPVGGTCLAVDSMSGIYNTQLATDALLCVVFIMAAAILAFSVRHWDDYRRSSSAVRNAYSATFFAPFILLLLLPSAQFLDVAGVQKALCNEQLTQLISMPEAQALGVASSTERPSNWRRSVRRRPPQHKRPPRALSAAVSEGLALAAAVLPPRGLQRRPHRWTMPRASSAPTTRCAGAAGGG
jgi:hypothetical protein